MTDITHYVRPTDRAEYEVHTFMPGGSTNGVTPNRTRVEPGEGNVYSSELSDGSHAPVLDLDGIRPRLVPSSTEGNFHLYLDGVSCSWEDYEELLVALAKCGIIEEGYMRASIERKATFVRKPGVTKDSDPLPASPRTDDIPFP